MQSIILNFDNTADVNAAYIQLKKQYPKIEIRKADIAEMLEDEYLLALALEREKRDDGTRYSESDIMRKFGITEEDLESAEDVEIE